MKTIDITPTWEGILRVTLALYENGNDTGRATAFGELVRMAKLADFYVASQKVPAPLGAVENIGSLKDD